MRIGAGHKRSAALMVEGIKKNRPRRAVGRQVYTHSHHQYGLARSPLLTRDTAHETGERTEKVWGNCMLDVGEEATVAIKKRGVRESDV